MTRTKSIFAAIAALTLSTSTSIAQETGLPGNASSLREGHGDWQVVCAAPDGTMKCAMSQSKVDENRQRILSIELTRGDDSNTVNGVLVLPFGLDLASGVAYRLDDGQAGTVQPFHTCLPVGCIVDVAFDADTIASLRAGKQFNIIATADGGHELVFSVSLAGFSSAYDRVVELLR